MKMSHALLAAAVSGFLAGGAAYAEDSKPTPTPAAEACCKDAGSAACKEKCTPEAKAKAKAECKDGCKDGCKAKAETKAGEKAGCNGKDGCKAKDAAK